MDGWVDDFVIARCCSPGSPIKCIASIFQVDAYSFGVLLCEMINREFPDTSHRDEQIAMVTNPFFRDLIRRCLQHDPEKRPDMTQIISLLEIKK